MQISKISVLLPFHFPGKAFQKAIDSVLKQEGVDFELVLVNNNSDSTSYELAKSFESAYTNVKLVHESQTGIAFALNAGLKHCSGEYIARMDADDICLPGRLKLQADFLDQNPDVSLVSGLVKPVGMEGKNEGMIAFVSHINSLISSDDLFHFRFVEAPFAHPSVMFRKTLIERFGDYSTDSVPEDFELWLRWFSNGVKMAKLQHEVIEWHDNENRLSRQHTNYSMAAFDKVRMRYLEKHLKMSNIPALPIYIWGGGKLSRKKVATLMQNGIQISGFIDVQPNRKIEGFEVIHYPHIPPPGEIFIVSMVSNRGKAIEIKNYLKKMDYIIEKDFILSA